MTDKFGRPINRDKKTILKLQMLQKVILEIIILKVKWKKILTWEIKYYIKNVPTISHRTR